MKPLLIVKTGSAPEAIVRRRGDFERWIVELAGVSASSAHLVRVVDGESLPPIERPCGAIITGSSAMVSHRASWSEQTGRWLARAVEADLPLLGICYGHQLLAHALGGHVGPNPRGRQIGTVEVQLTEAAQTDALFRELPLVLQMQTTHVESTLRLPAGAELLATSERDPFHAFRLGRRCWGVQFHPEFDAEIMCGYIDTRHEILRAEGFDPEALRSSTADAPYGAIMLRRFAKLCGAQMLPQG